MEEGHPVSRLTPEAASALLGGAFGILKGEPLLYCRVNFFEEGYLALPPGAMGLVRQDMVGRRHTHLFPVELLTNATMLSSGRRQRALRFVVEGVVWQLDRIAEEHWDTLLLHVSRAPMDLAPEEDLLELEPDEDEEEEEEPEAPAQTLGASPFDFPPAVARDMPREPARPPASSQVPRPTPVDEDLDLLDQAVATGADPDKMATVLHRLFLHSQALGQGDRTLMVAQALLALGRATPFERQLAERYQTSRVLEAEGPLTPEHWDALRGINSADSVLSEVISALVPALVRMTTRSPKDHGLKAPPEGASQLLFGRVFQYVRRVCSDGKPIYHPHPEGPRGMAFANLTIDGAWMPTLVVGADCLSGRTEAELAFRIGRELTFLRKEHLLSVLTPSLAQQAVLVLTAVAMAAPDQPIAGEEERAIKTQLSHLSRHMELEDFERVSAAVRRLLGQSEPFDLPRWNRAVERAALRVGAILCGDVQIALRSVGEISGAADGAMASRAELIHFAVSNLHIGIRRDLRLAAAGS